MKDLKSARPSQKSLTNLEFLLAAMSSISRQHSVTKHFVAQLDVDIEAAGLRNRGLQLNTPTAIPNAPINGLLAARDGLPMTYHELRGYAGIASPQEGEDVGESGESRQASISGSNIAFTPLSGIMASDSPGSSPDPPQASISTWDTRTTSIYVPTFCADPERSARSGSDLPCGGKSIDMAVTRNYFDQLQVKPRILLTTGHLS